MVMGLFKRGKRGATTMIDVRLNARLRPMDRGERFEDPLDELLRAQSPGGRVTGGGTMISAEGEPLWCDVEVEWAGDPGAGVELVAAALTRGGAPRGSQVTLDDAEPVPFGEFEGLGLYLNGTDLPAEVYATSDVNELISTLLEALGPDGDMYSYWEGPTETALYLYGPSAEVIEEKVAPVLASEPSAALTRVVRLT
jgi:hypothetical protein